MTLHGDMCKFDDAAAELFCKIRVDIAQHSPHYLAAGQHIDATFDEQAVRQHWAGAAELDLAALDRVGMCFRRFILATTYYLQHPPHYLNMRQQERLLSARTILLLTWIVTDADADRLSPALTELQNWPWSQESTAPKKSTKRRPVDQDESYHRRLARSSLFGFKGEQWHALVQAAWHQHSLDMKASHLLSGPDAPRSNPSQPTDKPPPKWQNVQQRLEHLASRNPDTYFSINAMAKAMHCDRKTIKKAIEKSVPLKSWRMRCDPARLARERPMRPGLMEATPQTTEPIPLDTVALDDNVTLEQLIAEHAADDARDNRQTAKRRIESGSHRDRR